ncbi:MAG: hypothetical protein HY438_01295 [DPANN group archaeon]|nr:hypothetical protein [DPANN group archaeon]
MAKVKSSGKEKKLIEFYGDGCVHCEEMAPLVGQLEKELGVKFEKYEVWNNMQNANMLEEYDKGRCGGVPFFFNTATGEFICGAVDYETFKKWAIKG